MPYYHNFSWYYFLKYVVGFAGMFFLCSGFLKEKAFACVCSAADRESARQKGENACDNYTRSNESSPTGETTDARAKKEVYVQSCVPVDVKKEHICLPMKRQRKVEQTVFPKCPKVKCAANYNLQAYKSNLPSHSSSDGYIEVRRSKKNRFDYRRASKNRQTLNRNQSCQTLRTISCLELDCKENCDRRIFDAVTRANLEVRNSFAKQENLELEAFACLVINQGLEPHFEDEILLSSSSSNPRSFQSEDLYTSFGEKNSSSDGENFPIYGNNRWRIPRRDCRKNYTETPSTSFASVRSRSGSVYFTASSRGKKLECQIHGHGASNINRLPERRNFRCRIVEESDGSNEEIRRKELTVDRRRFGGRRATRCRLRCN